LLLVTCFFANNKQQITSNQEQITNNKINITKYVPMDHGRTWTYQWTVRYADGRKETTSRTKSFEGPEFLPTGYAYRFVSDLGDYVLLSVDNQALRMHGSVEPHRAIRFTFDPPVVLYSPEMEVGRPYTHTQQNEEGATQTWTTVVDWVEDVNTPMGKFSRCLRIRVEMNSSNAKTKAAYSYAQGLGLIAYQYEAWGRNKDRSEVAIDASLKLAQLAGRTVTSASELESLKTKVASGSAGVDDPEARKMFRQAYERLYTWPAKFPGFQADFILDHGPRTTDHEPSSIVHRPSSIVHQGTITVTPDLKMKVNSEDKPAGLEVETQMSQFIAHLKDKPFDSEFGAAILTFGDRDPVEGTRIEVSAPNTMGTSYRIKDGQLFKIGHSYGRVRFVVNHTDFVKTDDGRLIAASFRITYYSNETNQVVDEVDFQDEYTKVQGLWLPKKRVRTETAKGQTSTLVVEFTNHRIL
jgi:hypothetical protein